MVRLVKSRFVDKSQVTVYVFVIIIIIRIRIRIRIMFMAFRSHIERGF